MAITIERIVTPEFAATNMRNVFLRGENSYTPPAAGFNGASFPALPTLKHITLATTVFISALGTASAADAMTPTPLTDIRFILPASIAVAASETAAERYRRLRSEIVAAGIPLLGDEELREEIESRRGDRES
jgi:hypothetical protein